MYITPCYTYITRSCYFTSITLCFASAEQTPAVYLGDVTYYSFDEDSQSYSTSDDDTFDDDFTSRPETPEEFYDDGYYTLVFPPPGIEILVLGIVPALFVIPWRGTVCNWGRNKMVANFLMTFLNTFSWIKMYEFRWRFHQSFFLRVQLTRVQ